MSINKLPNRNLINISVIKINPLTIEPGVMWRYFDFELLSFVIISFCDNIAPCVSFLLQCRLAQKRSEVFEE